jgi:hypothetical protein
VSAPARAWRTNVTMTMEAWIGVGLLLAIQAALAIRLLVALGRLGRLEERVQHLGDALTLLTETAESGFKTMADEIERLRQVRSRTAEPRPAQPRPASTARRGRAGQEHVRSEGPSESGARPRLQMGAQGREQPAVAADAPDRSAARPARRARGAAQS